jgi:CheY-like chemotaxis protein/two-component sensor histidine kinase
MTYAGKESAVVGLVDVSRTIGEMLALLKVSVSKQALLEMRLGLDLPYVRANAAQLQQVVMNLVTNASDAVGHRGGVIRVTTKGVKVDQDSWAVSHGLNEGDYVQLEVCDTGCGMPPEIQARVFDPFFTTKSAGHGLGLSIIYGIVRGLNGAIQVMSDPGKGTTFRVLLPCVAAPSVAVPNAVSSAVELAPLCREATILVVEDEDALRQPVSKLLRKGGFCVVEASDGSAAIAAIREHKTPIEFLLLDVTLPGASSQEVLEEAKRLRPGMKVIVTSAYSKDAAAASLQAKGEHFLRKPYRIADLVDLMRRL